MLKPLLAVALGGALGSVSRWLVALALPSPAGGFPWATFAVNLAGSCAIGAAAAWSAAPDDPWRLALVTGLLGGFTTYSAFAGETLALLRSGAAAGAAAYVTATVLGGLAAAGLGLAAAQATRR
jgi:CrcB protein